MTFVSVLAIGSGCGDDTGGSGASNSGGSGASNTGGSGANNTGGNNTGGNNTGGTAGDGGSSAGGDGGSSAGGSGGTGGGASSVECGDLCEMIGNAASSQSACMSQNLQQNGYNVIGASAQCAGITADEAACNGCVNTLEVTAADCDAVVDACF